MLTTAEASELMKVERSRVRQLAIGGRIPGAKKYGRDWMIPRSFAETYERDARGWPKGRARKPKPDSSSEERRRRVVHRRQLTFA